MEGTLLGDNACCINLRPFAILYLIAEQIVEPLLACIDTTEDKDSFLHYDSRVTIPRLWSNSF